MRDWQWVSVMFLGLSQWHTETPVVFPLDVQSLLSQGQMITNLLHPGSVRLMEQLSGRSWVLCVCLSSVDAPVICTEWTNRLLIAPVIAQEMFSQLHPFFLMWSTSLSFSVELSWREEQPAGWVISQAFTADSERHLLTLLAFLLWIFFCTTESFSRLLFGEVLFKETVLLLFFPSVSVFRSFPRTSASQCRG